MFNFQKFRMMALSGACMAALLGCSGDNTPEASTQNANTSASGSAVEAKTLAITAIVEHAALDEVRQGALEALAAEGYKEGETLTVNFQSAQGDVSTAGQIAKQFVSDNPDAVIAISTPSAQAMASSTPDIPIVFSAVTDPVEAKLVTQLNGSGTNITGATDALPFEPQLTLIKEILPQVKNIGFVYSPGEVNSTVALKKFKEAALAMGLQVIEAPAQRSSDIAMAAQSLVGRVDVIYTPTDNNVLSAYEALYKVAQESKTPLIGSNTDTVERGAIAALGVNYHDLGIETGKITARIFKGEKPGDIGVYSAQNLDLFVSKKHAQEQGVTLSQEVLDKAKKVVE